MTVATRAAFTGSFPNAPPRPPLWPTLAVAGTKDGGNPTFPADTVPENVAKVGSAYWCIFQTWAAGTGNTVGLASASDPDGPWTAYGGNPIYTKAAIPWMPAGANGIYAPEVIEHEGTFYLFYGVVDVNDGSDGHTGYATASSITGPYTDHGSPIISPASGWTSLRVGEPSVVFHEGLWVVAAMGETGTFGLGEKVGIWSGASLDALVPSPHNPVIDHGADTQWDDDLIADPYLLRANGLWWIMYSGGGSVGGTGTRKWHLGLAYATDPLGPWTKHPSNPILEAGSSGFDEMAAWRGSLFIEDGIVHGVYGGLNSDLSAARGGNFRLAVDG